MNRLFCIRIVLVFLIIGLSACQPKKNPQITVEELSEHVNYLASEELKGRYPGSEGDQLAAEYIEEQLLSYGLELLEDPSSNFFPVALGVELGKDNRFEINQVSGEISADFVPLALSKSGEVTGQFVFCGYGFKINSPSLKWDDFENKSVKNQVAVILLGAPEPGEDQMEDPFDVPGAVRTKILNARDAEASAVILVAGSLYDPADQVTFENRRESSAGIPVIRVSREFMDTHLKSTGYSIDQLESQLNSTMAPVALDTDASVSLKVDLLVTEAETRNIQAYIPAADTGDLQEWIVIGAHFDHLGQGGPGSSSRKPDTLASHLGADDNASGVSGLIEMAGYLYPKREEFKRSILFIAFAGEEMGLLGSKYFIQNTSIDYDQIFSMVNLDMIGRPNDDRVLSIGGTGTAVEFDRLLDEQVVDSFMVSKSPEGYGPSDHASFYQQEIPVLFYSTGAHLDYHTPNDTPEKLDYEAMKSISDAAGSLVLNLAQLESDGLTYQEAGPKASTSGRRNLKVTFGIMPDVSGAGSDGLRVEFATPGKPAALGGMEKGDRITGINGKPVTNIYDYMTRLQQLKTGQTVSVEIMRNDEKKLLLLQL